ncbi:hypothetical protein [Streptosporangium sp. CA-115845]|uniref:hypothetical protein n=1 Tax=Streptosporangium sp. CA-115845 TaxID=3240071 RepID=UPI003D8B3EF7
MAMTGTFVLSFARDAFTSLTDAVQLAPAALGLLFRYLTRPPRPGISRDELAADYGVTRDALRRTNTELIEAGLLLQDRRPIGKGEWQHLIVAAATPAELPSKREAWTLLDAALAADRVNTSPESADVATCTDVPAPQVATSPRNGHIEPVNPFATSEQEHKPSVVATVAELRALAQLPPLPAPKDQADLWLTPAQVLTLATQYPPRYGDLALGVLARSGLPFYLAPRVLALMLQGYDTGQLARTLAGVQEGKCPAAVARWRLDKLLLDPAPNRTAAAVAIWRAPSTTITAPPAPSSADPQATARKFAALRATLPAAGARLRAGNRG